MNAGSSLMWRWNANVGRFSGADADGGALESEISTWCRALEKSLLKLSIAEFVK